MKYNIVVTPTKNNREWVLVEDFQFCASDGRYYLIPKGFTFDGASIPLGLRWMFPHGGRKFAAACAHDFFYRTALVNKETADRYFYLMMLDNEVPEAKAKAMYYGVKYCGRPSWNKRRKEQRANG